jgi:putative ABC transport system permease protein
VPTLTIDDAAALNTLPSVAAAAPMLQGFFQIVYGDDNSNSTVLGTTPEIFRVRSWVMDRGVPISDHDVRSANRVIVIGQTLAEQHYFKRDPIGQVLRIEGRPFTVIGVLAGTGRTLDGTDLGEMLIAPITAVPVRMPQPGLVHYISARARTRWRWPAPRSTSPSCCATATASPATRRTTSRSSTWPASPRPAPASAPGCRWAWA